MDLKSRHGHIIIFLIIVLLLLFFAYSKTFNGEFQFDDDTSVIENPYVTDISEISGLNLIDSMVGGVRPVTAITFALNYRFGGFDVSWYHLTNFLIHVFNSTLIFYLVLLTVNSPKLPATYHDRALSVALISAAIFLLHPVQTESVSYISQRYESLASLFYLCSLIAYIKARPTHQNTEHRAQNTEHRAQNTEHRTQSTEHRAQSTEHRAQSTEHRQKIFSPKSVFWYLTSVICYFLALGSKEIAVTLPVIILLYDFYFLKDRPFLKRVAGPGIFIVLSLIAGIFILSGFGKGADAGFSVKAFTPWQYLLTEFRVLTTYIRLLFLPVNQNLDYDFRISRSFFEIDTALSFVFLLILIIAAIMSYKRWRVGSFFILWFFIILAPTSSIIPVIDVIYEHRVYLASAGIFIAAVDAFFRFDVYGFIEKKFSNGRAMVTALVAIALITLSAATFQRNKVWGTKLSLWEDAARKSPMKSRVHNNLGNCYMLLGRHFNAIEEYRKAIALDENNIEAYYNLAVNLDNAGLLNQAIFYYDIFYKKASIRYNVQKEVARKRIDSFYNEVRRTGH